jgi:hypothetical protein
MNEDYIKYVNENYVQKNGKIDIPKARDTMRDLLY